MTRALLIAILSAAASDGGPATRPAEPPAPAGKTLRQQLWNANSSAPDEPSPTAALDEQIQRLNAIQVATSRPASRPAEPVAPAPAPAAAAKPTTRPSALAALQPSAGGDPLAVAEALLAAGAPDKAADFFAAAAATQSDAEEKTWLLYRSASCLRSVSPTRAIAAYDKLASEAPQSLWAEVALKQKAVLEWQQANQVAFDPQAGAATSRPAALAAGQPAARPAGVPHD